MRWDKQATVGKKLENLEETRTDMGKHGKSIQTVSWSQDQPSDCQPLIPKNLFPWLLLPWTSFCLCNCCSSFDCPTPQKNQESPLWPLLKRPPSLAWWLPSPLVGNSTSQGYCHDRYQQPSVQCPQSYSVRGLSKVGVKFVSHWSFCPTVPSNMISTNH